MWLQTWFLAGLLLVVMSGSLELFWRQAGHFATVNDDEGLWAEARSQIDDDPRTVVLVGLSRMQLDVSSEPFRARYPGRKLVRLESPQRHPVSALEDLARDPEFRGTVIASISMPWVREGVYRGFEQELSYLQDRYGWNARFNRKLATIIQSHVVFTNPRLRLRDVIEDAVRTGRLPDPHFLLTHPDRSRAGYLLLRSDYAGVAKMIEAASRNRHSEQHISPESLLTELRHVDEMAERIRMRGGRVIFVRLPTTGNLWDIDESHYPRAQYWDVFSRQTRTPTLHFQDVPSLAAFECPDGSHLDAKDRHAFTEALLDEFVQRGWLTPPSP